jgi:hypothetical protein
MERPMTTVDGVVGAGVGLIGAFLLLDFTAKATKTLTQETNKSAKRVQGMRRQHQKNMPWPVPWGYRL